MDTLWSMRDLFQSLDESTSHQDLCDWLYNTWRQHGMQALIETLTEHQVPKRHILPLLHRFMREGNSYPVKELLHYYRSWYLCIEKGWMDYVTRHYHYGTSYAGSLVRIRSYLLFILSFWSYFPFKILACLICLVNWSNLSSQRRMYSIQLVLSLQLWWSCRSHTRWQTS